MGHNSISYEVLFCLCQFWGTSYFVEQGNVEHQGAKVAEFLQRDDFLVEEVGLDFTGDCHCNPRCPLYFFLSTGKGYICGIEENYFLNYPHSDQTANTALVFITLSIHARNMK